MGAVGWGAQCAAVGAWASGAVLSARVGGVCLRPQGGEAGGCESSAW